MEMGNVSLCFAYGASGICEDGVYLRGLAQHSEH